MKNYDETVSAVFDRIRDYNIKKKRRTVLACRVTATCCAVSLLGGSVWYLNRPQHDIPVTIAPDENTVTTTAASTEGEDTTTTITAPTTTDGGIVTPPTTTVPAPSKSTGTKAPTTGRTEPPKTTTTTVKDKLVITADEPEDFSSYNPEGVLEEQGPISPALKEKMEQYKGADVVYSVIVELLFSSEELEVYKQLPYTHDELIQLREERTIAFYAYIEAKEQAGGWYTQEVNVKHEVFKKLDSQYTTLLDNLRNEYSVQWRNQRLKELSDWSKEALIPLTTDTKYEAFHSCDRNYAFFMKLTAEEINDLAERDGYFIRLVFPGGDKIVVTPEGGEC